jgi:hypothetical protein
MSKRIAIVGYTKGLDTIPCVCNTIDLLAEAGYRVDVYWKSASSYVAAAFRSRNVSLTPLPGKRGGGVWVRARFLARHLREKTLCVIGVDPTGLIMAEKLARLVGASLAYFSLELHLTAERQRFPFPQWIKAAEIRFSRKAAFTIIQDEERGGLLAADNGLAPDSIVTVPNAPIGPGRDLRTGYWHKRFGLPENARVVLYAGNISRRWVGLDGVIASMADWPENWVLVIHNYRMEKARVQEMQGPHTAGRVFFSTTPVSRNGFAELIGGADIGIAFYFPQYDTNSYDGLNLEYIGLSSGKTIAYLNCGLPVIVNQTRSPLMRDLLEKYCAGVAITDSTQVGRAIGEIAANYVDYRAGALRLFDEALDFRLHFSKITARLERLAARR